MKRKIMSRAYFPFLIKYTQIISKDHCLAFIKDAPAERKVERKLSHRFLFLEMEAGAQVTISVFLSKGSSHCHALILFCF